MVDRRSTSDAKIVFFVAGVYPLLPDETCFFIAADFDKTGWDTRICKRLSRSESTRGAGALAFRARRTRVVVL